MGHLDITIDDCLNLIEEVLTSEVAGKIIRENSGANKFYTLLFLCKLYETNSDINLLIQNDRLNSVPILLRSALEISIDIKNIKKSDTYIQTLAYSAAVKKIERLNSISKFKQREPTAKVKREIKNLEGCIENISPECQKSLSMRSKFQKVKKHKALYPIAYSRLCAQTHSDIVELENQFFHSNDGKYEIHFDVGKSCIDRDTLINSIILMILDTLVTAAEIIDLDSTKYREIRDSSFSQLGLI